MKYFLFAIILLIPCASLLHGQQTGIIEGFITDENGDPLPRAVVIDQSTGKGFISGSDGSFQLSVKPNVYVFLEISFIGYLKDTIRVISDAGKTSRVLIRLKPSPELLGEVVVESWYDRVEALQQISLKSFDHIPLPSGNIESILTTMGASSRNEMSSQYSVRGGNYDENLIYVNDIEIYRPMLVKAGQQEGLSFINSSMVASVQFAAGGFDARYGDKMSSALDIRYKRPVKFAGSASVGLLGGSAHIEGSAIKNKFTHITGVRYKANQYLLNTLQTEGDYKQSFFDLQTFLTYDISKELEISFLGNLARNSYQVVPESRQTAFGTYQQTLNFTVYFEGQEKDYFSTLLGALTLDYHPTEKLSLKITGTGFNTSEAITYDILGEYRIDLLDNTTGSETANDSIINLGYGGNLTHARNYLDAGIMNLTHKGSYHWSHNNLNWGISGQTESFNDKIREWEVIDSTGYSIPNSDNIINLYNTTIAANKLNSFRFSGYLHDITGFSAGAAAILLNTGIRFNYLNTNQQLVISPRAGIHLTPSWENKITFHASVGWYHQPPFYKEMRDPDGVLHTNIKAQQSVHYVLGTSWDFQMWERPFRVTTEAYFKKLDHLIPYVIDDIDIQYLPQYTASGYATGIEFKINGEFVRDAESWASLSFLQTREDRHNDAYGDYPRPTDQLVNFGLFFQDYFPNNPSYRVHMNIYYGSRLPYNSTEYDKPEEYYYLKAYRRIDIGLSKSVITGRNGKRNLKNNFMKDLWFSAEVFNLFDFENQVSYQWVRTINNQEGVPNMFAIPNYLTGRMLNLRLSAKF